MKKSLVFVMALALTGSALSSCATNPATGQPVFSLVGSAQEAQLGNETAQQLIKEVGVYDNSALETYLNQVMGKVHANSDIAAEPIKLVLLDTDQFNASATPGYMMVNRGLLPYLNSEAQLAAILGHETGHNAAHHVGQQMTRGMIANLVMAGVGVYLGSKVENQAVANGLYTAAGVGATATMMAYSRGQENEADQLGLRYMDKAGYDGREAAGAFDQMQALDVYGKQQYTVFEGKAAAGDQFFGLLRSHPATPERQAAMVRLSGGELASITNTAGQQNYYRMIDGVDVGATKKQGVIGRDYIAFDKPQFVWKFGDGFLARLQKGETGQSVWQIANPATGAKGQIFFLLKSAHLNPATLMNQLGPKFEVPQNINVGGVVGGTAVARLNTGEYMRAVMVPIRGSDMMAAIIYRFRDHASEQAVMAATVQSKLLSEAEAKGIKPLRLKIGAVAAGDTLGSLADRLPQGALRAEWLAALNGWAPGQKPEVGALYKRVVDPNTF